MMMLRWPFAKVHIPLTSLCMFCMSASLFSFIIVRRLILAFNFASSWHFKYLTLSSNTVSQPVSPYHLSFVTRWLVKLSNLSSICCEGPHDPFRWPRGFVSFLVFSCFVMFSRFSRQKLLLSPLRFWGTLWPKFVLGLLAVRFICAECPLAACWITPTTQRRFMAVQLC